MSFQDATPQSSNDRKRPSSTTSRRFDNIKPTKRLKSLPPDVKITVGSGKTKKEFDCYSVILRQASDYFDAMLSHPVQEAQSARVDLPDKDPEEWELVYMYIDPAQPTPTFDLHNVLVLAPWFHYLQMTEYTKKCDVYFAENIDVSKFFDVERKYHYMCRDVKKINGEANRLFEYLSYCERHLKEKSLNVALEQIGDALISSTYSILLQANYIELIQSIVDIWKNYKDNTIDLDYTNGVGSEKVNPFEYFYKNVIREEDVVIDWDDTYCCLMMKERLSNLILKAKIAKMKEKEEIRIVRRVDLSRDSDEDEYAEDFDY